MVVVPDNIEIAFGERACTGCSAFRRMPRGWSSSRMAAAAAGSSPRNNRVAAALREAGLATLLLDLLTPDEERNRANVFDIPLLASRLSFAADWSLAAPETAHLPIGYFGASTGAASGAGRGGGAFAGAGHRLARRASRSGRQRAAARDRADPADRRQPRYEVIELNRMAHDRL